MMKCITTLCEGETLMINRDTYHFPVVAPGPMLFAMNSSREFGEQISSRLAIALSQHEEREFEDGEHKSRPLVSVRGKDVFVIQAMHADGRLSGNDKLCRLLFFIGALNDAAAARVTAVVPYLAYARKDRKTQPRDPVTTRYVAALFEAVGTNSVLTIDVHNLAAFQNAFRCRTEHLDATRLFVKYFAPLMKNAEVVVVAPDAGSIKRAERFRKMLSTVMDAPVGSAFAEKYRSHGTVSGEWLVGEVKGKDVIIIDDMISTGGTVVRTAQACHSQGANRVFAAATHGLFTGDAEAVLAEPALQRIIVTDSVSPLSLNEGSVKRKLTILSSAGLFASAIHRIHTGESLTELLEC